MRKHGRTLVFGMSEKYFHKPFVTTVTIVCIYIFNVSYHHVYRTISCRATPHYTLHQLVLSYLT